MITMTRWKTVSAAIIGKAEEVAITVLLVALVEGVTNTVSSFYTEKENHN